MTPEAIVEGMRGWRWSDDDIVHCVHLLMTELHKKRAMKRSSSCVICCGDKRLPDGRSCPKCR